MFRLQCTPSSSHSSGFWRRGAVSSSRREAYVYDATLRRLEGATLGTVRAEPAPHYLWAGATDERTPMYRT